MAEMPSAGQVGSGPDVEALRAAIVRAGRRLGARGLIAASEGNLSIRLPGNRILVTPSGVRKDELEPADLVVVDLEAFAGSPADGPGRRPTSDLAIHRAIYRARPDVGALAHAHLPAAMALTLAGERPDPTVLPETALFLPRLPVVPFGAPGSDDLARRIVQHLASPPVPFPGAAILERHGAIAVGSSLDEAVDRLEVVEVLCRTWRDALFVRAGRAAAGPAWPDGSGVRDGGD
jgi:L-fuculose-phosphate aldolase